MLKHLYTLLWNQRKHNGWLLAELTLAFLLVFLLVDMMYAEYLVYHQPIGYNITNCWQLTLGEKYQGVSGYKAERENGQNRLEDIHTLTDRLIATRKVESVGYSFFSCPYSNGNSWRRLKPLDADSVNMTPGTLHCQNVDVGFFRTFGIKDINGREIATMEDPSLDQVVLTEMIAHQLYGAKNPKGKRVEVNNNELSVLAVAPTIRESDYSDYVPTFYQKLSSASLVDKLDVYSVAQMEFSIRMKDHMTEQQMEEFLLSMGDQLQTGNIYVDSFISFENMRDRRISGHEMGLQVRLLVIVFLLFNIFFGVTGVFWLRTEYRRGENGVRMAIGASKRKIAFWLNMEGFCLLSIAIAIAGVVLLNVYHAEILSSITYPLSYKRFIGTTVISVLIIAFMISAGIRIPAYRAMKLKASDALHYE